MIELINVSKTYGTRVAVQQLNLQILNLRDEVHLESTNLMLRGSGAIARVTAGAAGFLGWGPIAILRHSKFWRLMLQKGHKQTSDYWLLMFAISPKSRHCWAIVGCPRGNELQRPQA